MFIFLYIFFCNQLLTFFTSKSDTLHAQPDIVVGVEIRHITSELSTQHSSNNLF